MTSSSEKTTKKAHGHHSTDSVARTKHTGSVVLLFAFPECVAKGSRFTLGVWGQSLLRDLWSQRSQPSASVRNRAQPLATVGNRRATLSLPKGCVIHSPAHTKHEVAAQLQAAPNLTLASRPAHSAQTAWIQGVFALVFLHGWSRHSCRRSTGQLVRLFLGGVSRGQTRKTTKSKFFLHEYGRHVCGVHRSSCEGWRLCILVRGAKPQETKQHTNKPQNKQLYKHRPQTASKRFV